jgi:hypothetical protein
VDVIPVTGMIVCVGKGGVNVSVDGGGCVFGNVAVMITGAGVSVLSALIVILHPHITKLENRTAMEMFFVCTLEF